MRRINLTDVTKLDIFVPEYLYFGRKRCATTTPRSMGQKNGMEIGDFNLKGTTTTLAIIEGPVLRRPLANRPLFLLIIRGQKYMRYHRVKHRDPRPYLVNASQDSDAKWCLPLDPATLIFWAWQRWEIEVCHRELKSNFGLGNKQCWNPQAAVASVQWSAWVYALLLLSAYRTWGICGGPEVPTRWWRGASRWSLNTLWRAFRAELWEQHDFRALWSVTSGNWAGKESLLLALRNSVFGSARS